MNTLIAAFLSTSAVLGLPPGLLSAICFVESSHRVKVVHYNDGKGDSLGACQIKLATAKLNGFTGTKEQLMRPAINVYYSGKELKRQMVRYDGDIRKAVSAYNAGTHRLDSSGQTFNRKYVGKVFTAWVNEK